LRVAAKSAAYLGYTGRQIGSALWHKAGRPDETAVPPFGPVSLITVFDVATRENRSRYVMFRDLFSSSNVNIRDYQNSGHFNKVLSSRTRADYRKKLIEIEREFGDMPLSACELKGTRGELRRWRDQLSVKSPRQADYTWSIMSAVFKHGIQYGEISTNPCALGGKLYDGSRVEVIWTSPQVGAFLHQRQYAHMHLPLLIGLWTGQREGDILRLKWSAYDGQVIRLKQRKGQRRGKKRNTAAIVVIPVAKPLKAALDHELAARRAAKVAQDRRPDHLP
jgi:integrase